MFYNNVSFIRPTIFKTIFSGPECGLYLAHSTVENALYVVLCKFV